ncbi:MAG: hypothetical protein KDK91_00545 [Gammaproteobacteria bacterium]|nr:hypothetical protein [Gammaproteobacteria bacterium]
MSESYLDVTDELWRLDIDSLDWSLIEHDVIWPERRRCAGWVSTTEALLLWGGSGVESAGNGRLRHNFIDDLWSYEPVAERWNCIEPKLSSSRAQHSPPLRPPARYTPVMAAVPNRLYLYGGYTEDALGKRKMSDLWIRENSQWREVPAPPSKDYGSQGHWPADRYGCMTAQDDDGFYVCGGFSDDGDHIDAWRFDFRDERWALLAPDQKGLDVPAPRYCAAMVRVPDGLVMFGGRSRIPPVSNFSDLWMLEFASGRWRPIHGDSPHIYDGSTERPGFHAKSGVARRDDHMYLWGGEGLHGHVSDLWRLDLRDFSWRCLQGQRDDDPVLW